MTARLREIRKAPAITKTGSKTGVSYRQGPITALNSSIEIEPVCTLPKHIWTAGEEHVPAIEDVTMKWGTVWVIDQQAGASEVDRWF